MSHRDFKNQYNKREQLRAKAEARLAKETPELHWRSEEILHELQIHHIELEMQNEELRQAHEALEASRDRYVDLYEFAPIGYLTLTAKGMIAEINHTGAKLLGVEPRQLIHRRFARFVTDQEQDHWYRLFLNAMANESQQEQQFDLLLKRETGATFYAHINCLRRNDLGTTPVLRLALTDVTALKQAEHLRLAATAFESQEAMFITDADSIILQVNQAYTKINGYTAAEAIGQTPNILKSGRHDTVFYKTLWEILRATDGWQGEIWNRRKNGDVYPAWLTITAVRDSKGTLLHYVASLNDITQQKAAAEQIEQLAFYDPLTNLPNRRLLKDRLHLALASSARNKQHGVLLFIDLDNFKNLNDTLGHDMGDLLLQHVAQRLISSIRENDTAARLGGDEFVVMLEKLHEQPEEAAIQAEIAGRKILAALNEPYKLAGHDYHCTSSIGATLFLDHHTREEELLKHVDIALYQAKYAGRNNLCFFDHAMQSVLTERAALEADLRLALEKQQLHIYFQLQTTHTGQAVGAEMLIRWLHPERGLVLPRAFIPLAEETGLIVPIGQWELEMACKQLQAWRANPQTQHLQLAVNVCARQLHQTDFVAQVRTILQRTAINPAYLKLELTESMVLDDIDDTIYKIQALKTLGVRFALDDFGTGYSSLSYLTQLPLDQLKIDQSFVHNIGVKHTDAVIVQTIIGMANNLGIEVIAEGVETEIQRTFLEQHGCDLCQGYLFSKPLPLAEFEVLLSTLPQRRA